MMSHCDSGTAAAEGMPGAAMPRGSVASMLRTAGGCEEPQFAGTPDRRGAICDAELRVDAADVRTDRVRGDGQLAGDLRPGQVRRKIPQYSQLARAGFCQ